MRVGRGPVLSLLCWQTSLVAQMVKCLPTMQETRVWSLGQEDLLEKEMATHSNILAWKIPWTEEPLKLQSMGSQRIGHNRATSFSLSCWQPSCFIFPESDDFKKRYFTWRIRSNVPGKCLERHTENIQGHIGSWVRPANASLSKLSLITDPGMT